MVLPVLLAPCAAMESPEPPRSVCESRCLVLAKPETLNNTGPSGRRLSGILSSDGGSGVDVVTATLTNSLHGFVRSGRFRVLVPLGSVQLDSTSESYLFVLMPVSVDEDFPDMERFMAIESYAIRDGRVCTFRPLKDYASGRSSSQLVNPPASLRTHCYSVDDLRRKSW